MTLIEELRNKKSRDNRELLDQAADRIEELEKYLPSALTNEENVSVKGKQVEEMVHLLNVGLRPAKETYGTDEIAKILYNAGYRKQSEGEWVDKPTGAYSRMQSWCSACGKHSGIGGIESNRHKPFCPNCGAKMKGGEECNAEP